jgi:hypothetical protein
MKDPVKLCAAGHELVPTNVYRTTGKDRCRICHLASQRLVDERRRLARGPGPGRWPSVAP